MNMQPVWILNYQIKSVITLSINCTLNLMKITTQYTDRVSRFKEEQSPKPLRRTRSPKWCRKGPSAFAVAKEIQGYKIYDVYLIRSCGLFITEIIRQLDEFLSISNKWKNWCKKKKRFIARIIKRYRRNFPSLEGLRIISDKRESLYATGGERWAQK